MAGLYDDLVMDHIKNARNYRPLQTANYAVTGANPLCGDEIVISLKVHGERIEDIAFQCTCCGISMASASMMTEMVKGRSTAEARRVLENLVALLDCRVGSAPQASTPEMLALLETVVQFPARARCATLPWTTLEQALRGEARDG